MGGGMLGMTLALRLAQNGFEVTIVEASERLGGLASPCKIGPYTWDQFYHIILLSDSNLLSLLEELNLTDQIHWRKAKTGFFTDGRLYSMSNVFEFIAFPPLNLLDKMRLGWTIFYASKIRSWKRLEQISVTDWLRRVSGERTFNKMWLPLLKSKLGENYKQTSASFIWATIARMYAARHTGLKKEMFGYVKGGYETILCRLQEVLEGSGVQTLCETPVTKITNNGHGIAVETPSRGDLEFDSAIVTIPCNHIPRLCPQLHSGEQQRFQSVTYQGVICATMLLKKPLVGYYITNITDGSVPFTALIEMTALVDPDHFGGNSLIYLPRYLIHNDPFWKRKDEDIKEEFITALESMCPTFDRRDIVFLNISRASQVLPIPTLDYSSTFLPPTKTSLEHIFVVNSAQIPIGTMNVNEVVGLANKKAAQIAELL